MKRSLQQICAPVFILTLLLLSLQGCKKDKDDDGPSGGTYPRTVSIQYKVSSPAGFTQLMQLQHTNETGGISFFSNTPLPFTKTFTKTVNRYDVLVLMFANVGAGQLKGEILIDGAVKASDVFTGSSSSTAIPGQVTYTFP